MIAFTLVIFLLSSSQGSLRSTGHYTNEDFEDALLEDYDPYSDINQDENDDYDDDGDDNEFGYLDSQKHLLKVLGAIRDESEFRQKKRDVPRMKPYEINNADDEDDVNRQSHLLLKYKKDRIKKKLAKKTIHHSNSKKESIVLSLEDNTSDKKSVIVESGLSKKKTKKEENNNQIATITVDDTVEKQQAVIDKINPRDIFLEADTNATDNKTKPTSHLKVPPLKVTSNKTKKDGLDRVSFIAVIAGCSVAGVAGIALAGYCWFKIRQESKDGSVLQPTGAKNSKGGRRKKKSVEDEKLTQEAQIFHYQHNRKQIQQLEPSKSVGSHPSEESSEEEEDGDEDTVYECPGLAAPGDMKVVNPLFSDAESHHSDKHSDSPSHDTADEAELKGNKR